MIALYVDVEMFGAGVDLQFAYQSPSLWLVYCMWRFDVSKTDNLVALDCERTRPLNLVLILAIFGHISAVILSQPVFSGEKATTANYLKHTSGGHISQAHYSTSICVWGSLQQSLAILKVYAKKIASAAFARTIQRKKLTGTPATK